MVWVSCLAAIDGKSLHIATRKNAFDQKSNSFSSPEIQTNNSTPLRTLPEIQNFEPQFIDQHYQRDQYWEDDS